jgi:uncharacterized RDD family membrane protein YckC
MRCKLHAMRDKWYEKPMQVQELPTLLRPDTAVLGPPKPRRELTGGVGRVGAPPPCVLPGAASFCAGDSEVFGSMRETEPRRIGISFELKPHAYDPAIMPELFEGVLSRRILAFFIDVVVIAVPVMLAAIFVFVLGFVTFGLGWVLFWLLKPASVIWALFYYGLTCGSPASATLGMRVMDIELRTWYGAPGYFVLGAVRALIFWASIAVLTPMILLVGFFNERQRLLHDILVGTVVINSPVRAAALRGRPR